MAQSNKFKNIYTDCDRELILIDKIYQSFEALEYTLGQLKLEEPLFITCMAKKSFADKVSAQVKHCHEKLKNRKYLN